MKLFNKKPSIVKDVDKEALKENKKSKKTNGKTTASSTGRALTAWVYQPVLLAISFFAVSYLLMELLFIGDTETRQQERVKSILSTSLQYGLNGYIDSKLSAMAELANSNAAETLLQGNYQSQEALLKSAWAELDSLYPVPSQSIEDVKLLFPKISFASIDLLRRSAQAQKVKVEAFFHQDNWYFQVAAPVKQKASTQGQGENGRDESVGSEASSVIVEPNLGVLLATFKLSGLVPLLNIPSTLPAGEVAIVSAQGRVVASKGQGNIQKSVSLATRIDQWNVRYSPLDGQIPGFDRSLVWIIFSVMAVLLAAAVMFICRMNIQIMRKDMQLAVQQINKAITNEGKVAKSFSYGEFYVMSNAVAQHALETVSRVKKTSSSSSSVDHPPGQQAGKVDKPEKGEDDAPLFDDDLLDLDVLSESNSEQDLFEANSVDESSDNMVKEVEQLDLDIPQSIFRAYDIRGIVDETLNEGIVELIGKALASEALLQGRETLCVGYDGRLSSVAYCNALTRGIVSTGANVIVIGQVPTPVLYFSTHHFDTGSGVMITGSHNPGNYNGFKMMIDGNTLSGDDIQKLYNRIILQDFSEGQGSSSEQDVTRDYVDTILNDIAVASPLKVVVDAGNGVAGGVAPELIEELGCEVIPLYCEVDGNFPNHHPDPGRPENLQDLIAAVKEHDADIGLAFDGDGDRIGVVTNEGKIIWPDRLLMLFAKDVVSRNPGADIIFDVKCSRRLNGLISSYGGRPIMWKTGHSLIKAKMKETGALLAGEMSGHVFFKERWYGFDDGLYAAARLLEVLGIEDKTAEEVFASFPEDVSTPEINIPVTDDSKFELVEKLCARKAEFLGGNVSTIDGLRVDYPNGWGLCRASNTTPTLVLRFEADDEIALQEIKEKFITQLQIVDQKLDCDF